MHAAKHLATRLESVFGRLFRRRITGVVCCSEVNNRPVQLPSEFIRAAQAIQIGFTVQWPWLLPRIKPPDISVEFKDESGRLLATVQVPRGKAFSRTTCFTHKLAGDSLRPCRQICARVVRVKHGQLLEEIPFQAIDLRGVVSEIGLPAFETIAVLPTRSVVTDRIHERVEQIRCGIQLILANHDHASYLHQIGIEMSLSLCDDRGMTQHQWSSLVTFAGATLRWELNLGPPEMLFRDVPGRYGLTIRIGEFQLATRSLSLVRFADLREAALARVRLDAILVESRISVVNHRGASHSLEVVAEDFRQINVRALIESPSPDPLLAEVNLPLRLVLNRRGQTMRTLECMITLCHGRIEVSTVLELTPALFNDGEGTYALEIQLDERQLERWEFRHKTRQRLLEEQAESILQSLTLKDAQLWVVRDGECVTTDHVFVTDELLIPKFIITGAGFDEDVPGIRWRLKIRLIHLETSSTSEKYCFLNAKAGENAYAEIQLPTTNADKPLCPGQYALQLYKRDELLTEFRFRFLALEEIAPYTRSVIRDSLRAESMRVLAVAGGITYETSEIPDSTDFITPEFVVQSRGYNRFLPHWQTQMKWVLRTPAGDDREIVCAPITLEAKPQNVRNVLIQVRDRIIGQRAGDYRLTIVVADREVVTIPFRVLSPAEVRARVRVSELTIEAVTKSQARIENVNILHVAEHHSLLVHCRIEVGLIAPGQSIVVGFTFEINGRAKAHTSCDVSLAKQSQTIQCRLSRLADLLAATSQSQIPLTLSVSINNQAKLQRTMTLNCSRKLTDYDGQLTVDPRELRVEDQEYQQILNNL